jgi:anti-anti-sigma regulatory factor
VWHYSCLSIFGEEKLVDLSIDRMGELAVVECEGTIVETESAYKLRNAITSLEDAHTIALDLSEVNMIGGCGLSVLLLLHEWAYHHSIQLKLFNPRWCVRERLEHASPIPSFDFVSVNEITAVVADACRHLD